MLPPQLSLVGRAPVRGLLGAPLPPAGRFDRGVTRGGGGGERQFRAGAGAAWTCGGLANTRLEGALPVANTCLAVPLGSPGGSPGAAFFAASVRTVYWYTASASSRLYLEGIQARPAGMVPFPHSLQRAVAKGHATLA